MKKTVQKRFALRFISGKYQGGEFALPINGEITIGRSSELDMVLVEDMVSRRHAKIAVREGQIMIEDFGSTNGSFVNGERITKCLLSEGDRILIGTSIIKLVEATDLAVDSQSGLDHSPPGAPMPTRTVEVRTISGSLSELSLPDLLQLFSASRKNGVLFLKKEQQVAKIFLREGQVISCKLEGSDEKPAMQCMMQVMGWNDGTFDLIPNDNKNVRQEIEMSTEGLLMECMRLLDEAARMEADLPATATLSLNVPLPGPLSKLPPQELDVLQLSINLGQMQSIVAKSPYGDVDTRKIIQKLISEGYLRAK